MFETEPNKLRSNDRVLVLAPIDGKKPKSTTGLVDNRLFTGENTLHAIMDPQTCIWRFHYTVGILPQPLKQNFTSFERLYRFAEGYFRTRNIEIKEVIDDYKSKYI